MQPRASKEFVLELGIALHRFGTPAHRLEDVLTLVSERLGLQAHIFTAPTQLLVGFGPIAEQETALVRVHPGDIDLGKLSSLDQLADCVIAGEVSVEEGVTRVRDIVSAPRQYGPGLTVLAFAVASAAFASFFGGGLSELVTAGVIGVIAGVLALAFSPTVAGGRVFELVAAWIAAVVAIGAAHAGFAVSWRIAMLAGLIVLIPGLSLTIAMNELATRNLASGTARLTATAIVFLEIAFGVALGEQSMARIFGPPPNVHGVPFPSWVSPIALLCSAMALVVLFQARPKAAPWVLGGCLCAFYGSRLGAVLLGPELGACVGGFVVAAASNLVARIGKRAAMVSLVPGILLLVPGSVGFRSLSSMIQRDVLTGVDTAFSAVLVATSLVAGLLVANVAVPPRRKL